MRVAVDSVWKDIFSCCLEEFPEWIIHEATWSQCIFAEVSSPMGRCTLERISFQQHAFNMEPNGNRNWTWSHLFIRLVCVVLEGSVIQISSGMSILFTPTAHIILRRP
jgi:hypothetical protein